MSIRIMPVLEALEAEGRIFAHRDAGGNARGWQLRDTS